MVKSINFSDVQEPDESLINAPSVGYFAEGSNLDANSSMLRFQGTAGTHHKAFILMDNRIPVDRILAIMRILLTSGGGASDYAGIGVYLPSTGRGYALCNVGVDSTDKIYVFDLTSNSVGPTSLDSVSEYSTSEGLIKMELHQRLHKSSKSLPETRWNINVSYNGTIKHTNINGGGGRMLNILPPILFVCTYGASSYVSIRYATISGDSIQGASGYLEAI
jgi:hypothetical protein